MRSRRLAVLVLTLASVTVPAAPVTNETGVTRGHTLADETLEVIINPPRMEPGPGGPLTCCAYG